MNISQIKQDQIMEAMLEISDFLKSKNPFENVKQRSDIVTFVLQNIILAYLLERVSPRLGDQLGSFQKSRREELKSGMKEGARKVERNTCI